MAITINSTVGDANANSYVEVTDADTWIEASEFATSWSAIAAASGAYGSKEYFLVRAGRVLDRISFPGYRVVSTQGMQWPRIGVENPVGIPYANTFLSQSEYWSTVIPQQVKNAQMQLAGWLAAQLAASPSVDPFGADGTTGLQSVDAGPVKVVFDGKGTLAGPDYVRRVIMPMLAEGNCVEPLGTVRLTR